MRGKTFFSLIFKTRSLPCFTDYYNRFYLNSVKLVPLDLFHDINEISLSMWIEGDGYHKSVGRLQLCTYSYTLKKEVVLLMNVLLIKYDIKSTIIQRNKTKAQYRISISKSSMDIIRSLVKPYISKSLLYKIHL